MGTVLSIHYENIISQKSSFGNNIKLFLSPYSQKCKNLSALLFSNNVDLNADKIVQKLQIGFIDTIFIINIHYIFFYISLLKYFFNVFIFS